MTDGGFFYSFSKLEIRPTKTQAPPANKKTRHWFASLWLWFAKEFPEIFCEQCGKRIGDSRKFCVKCGSVLVGRAFMPPDGRKLRDESTSFFLLIFLVIYGFLFISFVPFTICDILRGVELARVLSIFSIVTLVSSGTITIGLWGVIKHWKRWGFYLFAFGCVVDVLYSVLFDWRSGFWGVVESFGGIIILVFIFVLLRIKAKHNGLSTWEQLT